MLDERRRARPRRPWPETRRPARADPRRRRRPAPGASPSERCARANRSSAGISSRQASHQVAHTLTSTAVAPGAPPPRGWPPGRRRNGHGRRLGRRRRRDDEGAQTGQHGGSLACRLLIWHAMQGMAERQGASPPKWLVRPRRRLLADVAGGLRQNWDKLVQLFGLAGAFLRPGVVRRRLERLRALGHIDTVPTVPQLLVAGRDQMIVGAAAETKMFYRSQGIPWVFHNLRRFISGPATMLDPIGLFSPRDAIIHHVLQTFHRHPHLRSGAAARARGRPGRDGAPGAAGRRGDAPAPARADLADRGRLVPRAPAGRHRRLRRRPHCARPPASRRPGRRSRADAGHGPVQRPRRLHPLRLPPSRRLAARHRGLADRRLRRNHGDPAGRPPGPEADRPHRRRPPVALSSRLRPSPSSLRLVLAS